MAQVKYDIGLFFEECKGDVERAINEMIRDKIILSQLSGGKRLRPIISLLAFKACTGGRESLEEYRKAVEGTVSIELAHTASLIHDDIIDKDVIRRGKLALHVQEGVSTALLVGHKMLALGFKIALKHGPEFARLYVDTWNEALAGELMEVEFNKRKPSSEDLFSIYITIIDKKTASLFSSACRAGALQANANGEIADLLAEYGREVGRAYQFADDLVDLKNGEMLRSVILPLIEKITGKKIGRIRKNSIEKKLKEKEEEIKEFYLANIREKVKKAEELIKNSTLPKSIYREMLTYAPKYIINRMLESVGMVI